MRFSSAFLTLCLVFSVDAYAAPSVRVLGGAAGYATGNRSKPTDAKTGNNIKQSVLNTGTGATKSASVRNIAPKNAISTTGPRAASSKVNTGATGAATNTERFPGILTKSNIQSATKVAKSATSGSSDYQNLNNRVKDIEHFLDSDVATSKLSDYYYTKDEVERRIGQIDTSGSSQVIRNLQDNILELKAEDLEHREILNGIQVTIQNLETANNGVHDSHTNEDKTVFFVNTFNENNINWDE